MFCPNCGKVLPDNANFCDDCGAVIAETEVTPKKAKNSAFPPWIIAIIVILSLAVIGTAALLIYTIIAENKAASSAEGDTSSSSYVQTSSDNSSSDKTSSDSVSSDKQGGNSSDTSSSEERQINPTYEKFYSDCGLTPPPLSRVISAYDEYDKYAVSLDNLIIDEYEAGYENGIVMEMNRYIHFSEGYIKAYYGKDPITDADLDAFMEMMVDSDYYATLLGRKNVTCKMEKSGLCVVITQRIVDLDDTENLKEMFGADHPLSRQEMQNTFKDNGYTSKFL